MGGAVGDSIVVRYSGIVTLTTAQWDAIAGTVGGLSGGDRFWISTTTPGFLTNAFPVLAAYFSQVGVAMNPTQMFLTISPPVKNVI